MSFGKPAMFGGFGRDALDVSNELLVALPGCRKRSLGLPLGVPRLLRLQHDTLLDALEPGCRPVDLCPQGGFTFGVRGAQRVEFLEMGGSQVVQRLFRLRADGVPFGRGCFSKPERGVTSALDGREGTNRAHGGHPQIAADSDVEAVRLWLAEYAGSLHTLRSYRKEAVRLLLWATRTLGKPLSSLTREDFLLYEQFLAVPTGDWVDPARPRRGGARRLFDGPLSERSRHQALGIVSGLLSYLVSAGYLAGNPLALRRRTGATARRVPRVERYLDHALWDHVLASIEQWPRATARDHQHYERSRWLIRLLYHTGLRVSEAANAKAADFYQRRGRWWLHVVGKGGGEGEVPVSAALMADFARYRVFYGLAPTPLGSETAAAVMSVVGDPHKHLTPAAVYLIVKEVFRRAAGMLESGDVAGAETLRRASTHWLRHSAASHQADAGTDLRFIQKNMRHASIQTTGIYLHAEDDQRHAGTVRAQVDTVRPGF